MSHPPLADQHDTADEVILSVDTHKDVHVAAAVSINGVLLDSRGFPTTAEGYQAMLNWSLALGPIRRAGVEGTHSYGAALTRHLLTAGISVIEVNQPDKAHRRRRGKTDAIDAEAAARAVLSGTATALAKAGDGHVERIRLFKLAKASATKSRAQAINQLKAVLVGADSALRDSMTGLSNPSSSADAPTWTRASRTHRLQPPPTPCACWLAGSSNSPARSRTSTSGSPRPSAPTHPSCCSGTASAPTPQQLCSWPPATTRSGSPAKRPLRPSAESAPSRCPPARPNDAGSTAAAIAKPTQPST
nr:transposase [Micromonospora viridifaciens]